jgi:hypothetical protein
VQFRAAFREWSTICITFYPIGEKMQIKWAMRELEVKQVLSCRDSTWGKFPRSFIPESRDPVGNWSYLPVLKFEYNIHFVVISMINGYTFYCVFLIYKFKLFNIYIYIYESFFNLNLHKLLSSYIIN